MRILTTFPGRNGDLLWGLPVIRAISEHFGTPVDLQIGGEFTDIVPLLSQQSYLGKVWADPLWSLTPPDEWKAPLREGYDCVFHCGYRGWPQVGLPFWVEQGVKEAYEELRALPVDYQRPWIAAEPWTQVPHRLVIGFTDEWFELKYGVLRLIARSDTLKGCSGYYIPAPGSRWVTEGGQEPDTWEEAARRIAAADVFFGCCSALHVLAVAMGKKVIVMEPSTARHNPIFYPFGTDGRVKLVTGNDGKPTHDARHVADAIKEALRA